MKYALLIYAEPDVHSRLAPDELERVRADYYALRADPACLDGAQLHPPSTATTVRAAGAQAEAGAARTQTGGEMLVTDGPFAETKEVFGGYYVVEAPDLDAATALAQRLPTPRLGGAIEIRPLVEMPDAPEPGGR